MRDLGDIQVSKDRVCGKGAWLLRKLELRDWISFSGLRSGT